jgi:hypothetical protein
MLKARFCNLDELMKVELKTTTTKENIKAAVKISTRVKPCSEFRVEGLGFGVWGFIRN